MTTLRVLLFVALTVVSTAVPAQRTQKPPLHAQDWMAVTGKPLGATAGARIFMQGGMGPVNAIMLDRGHGTFWGASSNHGEEYGIGW